MVRLVGDISPLFSFNSNDDINVACVREAKSWISASSSQVKCARLAVTEVIKVNSEVFGLVEVQGERAFLTLPAASFALSQAAKLLNQSIRVIKEVVRFGKVSYGRRTLKVLYALHLN
jgi:hypothetical protein